MSPRRVRVPHANADFRTPRGWPTPTDAWIRANVYWQPPAGWVPVPGLRPAPAKWRFWVTNPAGRSVSVRYFRPAVRWRNAATAILLIAALLNIAAWRLETPDLRLAAGACAATGMVFMLAYLGRRRRMARLLFEKITEAAAKERAERLTREYQRYLLDAA